MRAFVGEPTVLIHELPDDRRPAKLAVHLEESDGAHVPSALRLVSYNIQRAYKPVEISGSLDALIRDHRPDVLLLQEAPADLWRRPELSHLFEGMNLFYAPFHQVERSSKRFPHASYGQLIATPLSLRARRVIELPTVTRAGLGRHHVLKRIALYAEIPLVDGRSVRLINTHNEPFVRPKGRFPQFREALDHLSVDRGTINLYCGDLNTAFGQDEPGLDLFRSAGYESAMAEEAELDDCLASGHRAIEGRAVDHRASDHRPIVVDVML